MSETWQEIIDVDYTYDCPTDNFLEGTTMESVTENYNGPARLVALVDKETKTVEVTLREWEAYDGRPGRLNCDEVVIDCSVDALICEVLSDYHNNHLNRTEGYIEPDGHPREIKSISTPDGYTEFTWNYPIHPDEMYDDRLTTYEDGAWNLYKNTNEDIVGNTSWVEIREERNNILSQTDGMAAATDIPAILHDPVIEMRQKLRDLPEQLKDVDPVFIPSSFPPTRIISNSPLDTNHRQDDMISDIEKELQ
jgi:hypothetical protein